MTTSKPSIWVPGDWNALFGFGTNILLNLLVLTGLLRFVLKMPDDIVFGRILPACGLMLFMSTMYYAWLAYQLAKKTGRNDVTALPSGTSVPHMFVVVFVIMLPIALKTGDPIKGWEAGLTWVFIQSFVLMIGGFVAPWIRKVTPRAALLGTLAGVSIAFISMRPALEMFMTPLIGVICFAIIMASWLGGIRYFKGIPPGLVAIGGRIGYSAATGIMVILLAWFGIISVMMALIPVVAIAPILLYIGMLIGSQAFQETPRSHAPAIILGLVPHVAAWGKLQIDGALGAAGTNPMAVCFAQLCQVGVLYQGLQVIGGGAILGGLVLTSIAVFVIDRAFSKAGIFATIGAGFTFFGFMHGQAIGFSRSPVVALAYLGVAGVMFGCAKYATALPKPVETHSPHGTMGQLPS